MRIIVEQRDILVGEILQLANLGIKGDTGQGTRLAAELLTGLVETIVVEVKITEGVDKLVGLRPQTWATAQVSSA